VEVVAGRQTGCAHAGPRPGIGVAEKTGKIFLEFYRVNDSLSSGVQGTGLGLTSRAGSPGTLAVTSPALPGGRRQRFHRFTSPGEGGRGGGMKQRILVVEDDLHLTALWTAGRGGVRGGPAVDGNAALKRTAKGRLTHPP